MSTKNHFKKVVPNSIEKIWSDTQQQVAYIWLLVERLKCAIATGALGGGGGSEDRSVQEDEGRCTMAAQARLHAVTCIQLQPLA